MKKNNLKIVKIDKNKSLFNYEKKILIKELILDLKLGYYDNEKEKMPNHRLLAILNNLADVDLVVTMAGVEKPDHEKIISWDEFILKGSDISENDILELCKGIDLNDTSSLIYTSGTTGNPKVEIIAMVKIAAEIPRELRTYLTDSL